MISFFLWSLSTRFGTLRSRAEKRPTKEAFPLVHSLAGLLEMLCIDGAVWNPKDTSSSTSSARHPCVESKGRKKSSHSWYRLRDNMHSKTGNRHGRGLWFGMNGNVLNFKSESDGCPYGKKLFCVEVSACGHSILMKNGGNRSVIEVTDLRLKCSLNVAGIFQP